MTRVPPRPDAPVVRSEGTGPARRRPSPLRVATVGRRGLLWPLRSSRGRRILALVAAFLVWELYAQAADSRLTPSLTVVVERLIDDIQSGAVWFHARATIYRGVVGFGLALVAGTALGIAMARSRLAESAFEPFLAGTYPIPKLALYPVFILLFGLGHASKIALVALECIYPIAYNVFAGVRGLDRTLMWSTRNAEPGLLRSTLVSLRGTSPSLMAGVRIALPIMLVVVVVTEMIGESRGLGFMIRSAGTRFQPEGALAIVLLIGIVGFVLDRLVVALTRRIAFWEPGIQR